MSCALIDRVPPSSFPVHALEQPKKKRRIRLSVLKSFGSFQKIRVGDLQKSCGTPPISRGQIADVFLDCTVIDYMRGRRANRDGDWAFVNVADVTGTRAFGMSESNTGLQTFQVPLPQLQESTVCFFEAKFHGSFKWTPRRTDASKPIVSFRGTVESLGLFPSPLARVSSLCYPTTDVLEQIAQDDSARYGKYFTAAFIARVDNWVETETPGIVLVSLSDIVGAAVILISGIDNAQNFTELHGITEGHHFIFLGNLLISMITLDSNRYPSLSIEANSATLDISHISEEEYHSWENAMMLVPQNSFVGVIPEQGTSSHDEE